MISPTLPDLRPVRMSGRRSCTSGCVPLWALPEALVRVALVWALLVAVGLPVGAPRPARAQPLPPLTGWAPEALARLTEPGEIARALADGGRVGVIVEFAMPVQLRPLAGEGLEPETPPPDRIRQLQDAILARALGRAEPAAGLPPLAEGGEQLSLGRMTVVPMFSARVDAALLRRLAGDGQVLRIHPDRLYPPMLSDSVALIGMPAVWARPATGQGQLVAVLDTGARRQHEFLAGRVVSAACYSTHRPDEGMHSLCPGRATSATGLNSANDCPTGQISGCGHGTHVAGIAAGGVDQPRSGNPASGVARGAGILSIAVFTEIDGATGRCGSLPAGRTGCLLASSSDIIRGLERVHALRTQYQIAAVNLSLGGRQFATRCGSEPGAEIVQRLRNAGIAVIASAGNDGQDGRIGWPSCLPGVIAVANATKQDERWSSSNWGQLVDLVAPGRQIRSAHLDPQDPGSTTHYAWMTGTSMAAPHVAGAFAAIRSELPGASVDQILGALRSTGRPITSGGVTLRRIDVDRALQALAGPPRPANDDFANRIVIAAPGRATGTNRGATRESGEPALLGSTAHATSVWWRFTPQADGILTVDTRGSDFDTILGVYRGTSLGGLQLLAANGDIGNGVRQSEIRVEVAGGVAMAIVVAGRNGASGQIALNLALAPPEPAATRTTLEGPVSGRIGVSLRFTARVESGRGVPGGQVAFLRNGHEVARRTLSAGAAAVELDDWVAGNHLLEAVFGGSTDHAGSRSEGLQVVIARRPTGTGLSGPESGVAGQTLDYEVTVTAEGAVPDGRVTLHRDGTQIAEAGLDPAGRARFALSDLPAGRHQLTARYAGSDGFEPSQSVARSLNLDFPAVAFLGGGVLFNQTDSCHPALGRGPSAVTVRYTPAELGGSPTGLTLAWRSGAEHLSVWGALPASDRFMGGSGRASWARFVFYPTRPLIRMVERRILHPAGATDLAAAQELTIRLRVQNFAAIERCSVTISAALHRD